MRLSCITVQYTMPIEEKRRYSFLWVKNWNQAVFRNAKEKCLFQLIHWWSLVKAPGLFGCYFDALNKFKLRLQGDETNILQFKDILCGLVDKMKNWKRKVSQGNFAMFENLFQFRRLS